MPVDDEAAEAYLQEQTDLLSKKVGRRFDPTDENDSHRVLVDTVRCARKLRQLLKRLDSQLGVKAIPKMVQYLQK